MLRQPGGTKDNVLVSIDGQHAEVQDLLDLLQVSLKNYVKISSDMLKLETNIANIRHG